MEEGPLLILKAGNLGSGKSTLSKALEAQHENIVALLEPDSKTNPYLARFYKDEARWAEVVQLWMLLQRLDLYLRAISLLLSGKSVILDRSWLDDIVFPLAAKIRGNYSSEQIERYASIYSTMSKVLPKPSVLVYLDVSARECHRRVTTQRGNKCEAGIPFEYFQQIENAYFEVEKNMKDFGVPWINVPWNEFKKPEYVLQQISARGVKSDLTAFRNFDPDSDGVRNLRQMLENWFNHALVNASYASHPKQTIVYSVSEQEVAVE